MRNPDFVDFILSRSSEEFGVNSQYFHWLVRHLTISMTNEDTGNLLQTLILDPFQFRITNIRIRRWE